MKVFLIPANNPSSGHEEVCLPEAPQIGSVIIAHDDGVDKAVMVQAVAYHFKPTEHGEGRLFDHLEVLVSPLRKPGEPQIVMAR
jgi:hypothetical protein